MREKRLGSTTAARHTFFLWIRAQAVLTPDSKEKPERCQPTSDSRLIICEASLMKTPVKESQYADEQVRECARQARKFHSRLRTLIVSRIMAGRLRSGWKRDRSNIRVPKNHRVEPCKSMLHNSSERGYPKSA